MITGCWSTADCFRAGSNCGLKNWAELPFRSTPLDAVLLTHAHIDHSGYLPVLGKRGFRRRVYCTRGTQALAEILLVDAAHFAGRRSELRQQASLLASSARVAAVHADDARAVCWHLAPVDYGHTIEVAKGVTACWRPNGHIIGSASIEIAHAGVKIASPATLAA